MHDKASSAVNFYRCLCSVVLGEMSKERIVRLTSIYINTEREAGGRNGSTGGGSNRDRKRQREAAKRSERNGRMIFSLAV